MKKIIKNIGVLDVRKVTPELAGRLDSIENIGTYITNAESENILLDVHKKSIGNVYHTEESVEILNVNGTMTFDEKYFQDAHSKYILSMNGVCHFKNNVSPENVRVQFIGGALNGVAYIPEKLEAAFRSQFKVNGLVYVYDDDKTFSSNNFVLDEDFLLTYCGDRTVVVNEMVVLEAITEKDFLEVFDEVQVLKALITSRDNFKLLKPYIKCDQHRIKLIDGHVKFYSESRELTHLMMNELDGDDAYINGSLSINDSTLLEGYSGKLEAKVIKCYEGDYELVKSYCKSSKQKIKVIDHEKLQNCGTLIIDKAYIEGFTSMRKLDNCGEIIFKEDVNELDFNTINLRISNCGEVKVPKGIKSDIRKIITDNCGEIICGDDIREEASNVLYANMGFLKL